MSRIGGVTSVPYFFLKGHVAHKNIYYFLQDCKIYRIFVPDKIFLHMIVESPYLKSVTHSITKRMVSQVLNSTCMHPQTRTNRLGYKVFVPCGQCEECLRKKRNSLVSRLKYQINHETTLFSYFATYTYGDAQIYNEKLHIWEEDCSIPTLPAISREELHSHEFEYTAKGYYNVRRINVHDYKKELADGKIFGITYPRDMQLTLKKLRQRFEEDFAKYNLRIKVAWLNHYGLTEGKTHAPHFHVLYFITSDDKQSRQYLRNNPLLLSSIESTFRDVALQSWTHCGRWYDYAKQRFVGKDIEPVKNGNVASYVSRYISRDTEISCLPISRIFPIRRQTSKGIGYQVIDDDNS